jgi:23S rRNA pseudouridine2605 synthase
MKDKAKSAAKAPAKAARAPKRAAKPAKESGAASAAEKKTRVAGANPAKTDAKTKPATQAKPAQRKANAASAPAKSAAPRAKQPKLKTGGAKAKRTKPEPDEATIAYRIGEPVVDPLGDTTDGEGRVYMGDANAVHGGPESADSEIAAFRRETNLEASDITTEAGAGMEAAAEAMEARARSEARQTAEDADTEEPGGPEAHEPARRERLQKILSQAGVASRRRAEEMITEGRVMVNGQVVTTLGSKADPARDHIRVDGKLLHGAERHRYFVLNKPRGYVTTVSDPEGRPTVIDLLPKSHERLYPVGRLDFQSEGLLLMTNDGELANLLTKAGSGVEKTYLVKVAGRPSAQDLERLRGGVEIERTEVGSGRVRTAPARVRQVREGDNPWFEVVLIEGRNRELRKMFSVVGHFVEKIRRVGYGPLMLDVEPGKLRELTQEEVNVLRLTAEGKMKPRRLHADRMLPKDAGLAAEKRFEKRGGRGGREFARRAGAGPRRSDGGSFEKRERRDFGTRAGGGFQRREDGDSGRRESAGFQKRESGGFPQRERAGFSGRDNKAFPPRGEREQKREWRPRAGEFRGGPRGEKRPFAGRAEGQRFGGEKGSFGGRPDRSFGAARAAGKPGEFRERARFERPGFEGRKPFGGEKRPFAGGRPSSGPKREFSRPGFDRPGSGESGSDRSRSDRPRFDRPGFNRQRPDRTGYVKPGRGKPRFEKRSFDRPHSGKLHIEEVGSDKPGFGGRPSGQADGRQPEGRQNDLPRKPFRPQGDRPGGSKRPGKPGGAGRPKTGFAGKPTGFGGRPGGFSKPSRPGGFKRPGKPGGARPGGARPGGAGRGGRFGGGRPGGR